MGQQKQRKPFNKKDPGEGGRHFIALPSDSKHYIHHKRMNAGKLFLYQLIIDYFNEQEGYAYPSIDTLALHYGKTPDTTSRHIDDLKAVGLIDFPEKGFYVPLLPLTTDEFYGEFPEAWENYIDRYRKTERRRGKANQRMQEWRRQRGYK